MRNVPGRKHRRLVHVAPEVDTEGSFCRAPGKFQIGGSVVARICADHDQRVDGAGIEIAGQIGKSCGFPPAGGSIGAFDQINRRMQMLVDPMHQRMALS